MRFTSTVVCLSTLCLTAAHAAEPGLVAHWDFSEGSGQVLRDVSGSGHEGTIRNARWVDSPGGPALAFQGERSFVDFGDKLPLKVSGDFSFSAWIRLEADPYPNAKTNWHLFGWESYPKSGATLRLAGSTAQLFFRASHDGVSQGLSQTRLDNRQFYHVAVTKKGRDVTFYVDGTADGRMAANDPAPNNLPFTLSTDEQSFGGVMTNVRLYNQALTAGEVVALYRESGARFGKDVSWIGQIKLTPFIYYDEGQAIIEADFRGVLPLRPQERVLVALRRAGKPVAPPQERRLIPEAGKEDYGFDLHTLPPGAYEVDVSLGSDDAVRAKATVSFSNPAPSPQPPAPKSVVVPPLPPAPHAPPYKLEMGPGGGFAIRLGNRSYPVESTYSYPHGGENRLTFSRPAKPTAEAGWLPRTTQTTKTTYRTVAAGKYYRLTRTLELQPTRVLVRDQFENLTDGDVGLAVDNSLGGPGGDDTELQAWGAPNPPVFFRARDHGVGLVPLNDLYQLSQTTYADHGTRTGGSRVAGMGMSRGGSHTLEWAVYPVGTGDYYDLINAIRRDEGMNKLTVDGCLALGHAGQWQRTPPPAELIRFGGVKYAANGGLMKVADDPEISFQGIEFVRSTKENEELRRNYVRTRELLPGLKLGFHIAYNIWATNEPEQTFPDSRVLAMNRRHDMYGNFPSSFSEVRRKEGWAFYPYYPTPTNSFGRELLRSVDVMVDDIGADMVWADGHLAAYGAEMGDYPTGYVRTLEPWDGFSVELDSTTHTIARKYGLVVSLGKEVLIDYIHRVNAKGGRVWINHGMPAPRSFIPLEAYWACETMDGNQRIAAMHLVPGAPHALHTPGKPLTAQGVYDEVRAKLAWGAMYAYFWMYGAQQLTHPLITSQMYPLTVEAIHAGCIQGRERIITMNSGVYGWAGDRHLHLVRLFDARGRMCSHQLLSTTDAGGTRTQVDLATGQTAVVVKLPVTLQSSRPVNVGVTEYRDGILALVLNGQAEVVLRAEGFQPLRFMTGPEGTAVAGGGLKLSLTGPVELRLQIGAAPPAEKTR